MANIATIHREEILDRISIKEVYLNDANNRMQLLMDMAVAEWLRDRVIEAEIVKKLNNSTGTIRIRKYGESFNTSRD